MPATSSVPVVNLTAAAWGDVPGWVSAVAAILALAAAVAAALYVKRQFEVMRDQRDVMSGQLDVMKEQAAADRDEIGRQRSELAATERSRARAQAERIDVVPGRHYARLQGIDPGTFLTLTVHNASNRPIRSLRVRANPQGGDDPTHDMDLHLGRVGPDEEAIAMQAIGAAMRTIGDPQPIFVHNKDLRSPLALLRRDDEVSFLLPLAADRWPAVKYWLQFEDDAGLLWELDSDMHLHPITKWWA